MESVERMVAPPSLRHPISVFILSGLREIIEEESLTLTVSAAIILLFHCLQCCLCCVVWRGAPNRFCYGISWAASTVNGAYLSLRSLMCEKCMNA
ncbi:hypothetical protein CEXT_729601 [Caerostris extrusa]|uniref:Uncharacterized protein n=1 Tax=Caerostris extrusa TaxID=172846 RepID=A0AAV4NDJ7_CAEEX|nr:hypothetical protein CEXT_729601 [Caerostris extrusa]